MNNVTRLDGRPYVADDEPPVVADMENDFSHLPPIVEMSDPDPQMIHIQIVQPEPPKGSPMVAMTVALLCGIISFLLVYMVLA